MVAAAVAATVVAMVVVATVVVVGNIIPRYETNDISLFHASYILSLRRECARLVRGRRRRMGRRANLYNVYELSISRKLLVPATVTATVSATVTAATTIPTITALAAVTCSGLGTGMGGCCWTNSLLFVVVVYHLHRNRL